MNQIIFNLLSLAVMLSVFAKHFITGINHQTSLVWRLVKFPVGTNKKGFLLVICLISSAILLAQTTLDTKSPENKSKSKGVLAHLALGGDLPAGDLSDRFGVNGAAGLGLDYITPGNWIIGMQGNFYFGSKVDEDPLSILRNSSGDIIGNNRSIASSRAQERGLYVGGHVGKLITFDERRVGLRLTLGAGWTQHSIRIIDDSESIAQIQGDYKKGYDRLTGGPALQEFIGWQHLGYGRDVSWLVGFEFNQGFTNTRRDWDFSERRKLDEQRLDLRFGFRVAFTLPFYTGFAEDIYY